VKEPKRFLGANTTLHSASRITVCAKAYLSQLAVRFLPKPLDEFPAFPTPCTRELVKAYERAVTRTDTLSAEGKQKYASKVGAAIFAGPTARFDCLYTLGMCARCLTFPTAEMDEAADRCIAYMAQTAERGITFDGDISAGGEPVYEAYSDSDWSVSHSTTGGVHCIGGRAISACSKRQHSVALSSTEAEIMAASYVGAEVMYTRGLLREMGYDMSKPTVLWVDNLGAVELAKRRESSLRSRHIERRYLKIREWVAEGHIVVKYKNTTDNHADLFTKPLAPADFARHVDAVMGPALSV
jgi:hypothetical protein